MHDFKQIVARHAHPDAAGDWPVAPGSKFEESDDLYPKEMGPEDIKDAIEITIQKGSVDGDDIGVLVYSGSELQEYGLSKLVVRRIPDTGTVQTTYPQ